MVTGCPTLERKMPVQPEGLSCLGSETVLIDLHQARSWGADPCLVSGLGARNLTHSVDCTAENWAAVAGLLSFQHFALVGWRTVLRNSTCLTATWKDVGWSPWQDQEISWVPFGAQGPVNKITSLKILYPIYEAERAQQTLHVGLRAVTHGGQMRFRRHWWIRGAGL